VNINFDAFDVETIKNGYFFDSQTNQYICSVCGATFEKGEIYPNDNRFFEASRAVCIHMEKEHGDVFDCLLESGSKYMTLTDNQKDLIRMIHDGMADKDIASKMGISPSTVRHQKFMFREKSKQAKMYLAIYELSNEKRELNKDEILSVHNGAKMVDDRYITTQEESEKILRAAFVSFSPLKLKAFSPKEKKKIVVLRKIAEQFEIGKQYTEKEVNSILKEIFEDYVTLRRYLIEYGFMERTKNCSQYWIKQG